MSPVDQEGTNSSGANTKVSAGPDRAPDCVLGQDAPARALIEAIGDKWALLCLYALDESALRFNTLERRLTGISQKVLSATLKKLERRGLVRRTVYAEVPPRVEYRLSELGQTLRPVIAAMCDWARRHSPLLGR